ncbi:vitamin B12 ABC transporter ATP-binding protein BtuD [uncultured Vibrio sp.]|uniref:vitamin B12 ABC transporter ATP-binding protein BtuD n=1 Tax=uncultured Vibrio sp. TaxID=114054 RepID=UPI000914AD09|nr:vitamin B12 ABC transporter ATP-binding protein BtuD [uncultured Vibrio sp.]OIQ26282.1 MAG: vitamin B12 ABC transporter ATP-binding protein BtuD [Vibrio sp. MedPE-SWchi]
MIQINSIKVESRVLPLSFECKAGEILHVVGPNGSGKSTLLSAIAGVLPFTGSVSIGSLDVRSASLDTLAQYRAYLSQSARPAFNLAVFQYLALSVPKCCQLDDENVQKALETLTGLVDIEDKLHRSIHHLSGGEWQRVRLAAICLQVWPSLNPHAKLLILDEPGAPLDIGQQALLYQLIDEVAHQGLCVIMANHDLNRALKHADSAVLLNNGIMQKVGKVEEVLDPTLLSDVFQTTVKKVEIDQQSYLLFD